MTSIMIWLVNLGADQIEATDYAVCVLVWWRFKMPAWSSVHKTRKQTVIMFIINTVAITYVTYECHHVFGKCQRG